LVRVDLGGGGHEIKVGKKQGQSERRKRVSRSNSRNKNDTGGIAEGSCKQQRNSKISNQRGEPGKKVGRIFRSKRKGGDADLTVSYLNWVALVNPWKKALIRKKNDTWEKSQTTGCR